MCHYEGRVGVEDVDICGCTHLVYTGESRGDDLADLSKALLERKPKLKILLRTNGKEKVIFRKCVFVCFSFQNFRN